MSRSDPTASEVGRLQTAADWVQQLNESHDQELIDRWMHWCATDALNLAEFEQMQRLWNAFPKARATASSMPTLAGRSKPPRRLIASAAAVVLLVSGAGWFALHSSDDRVLETALGEQRGITLADGSRLDLAPASLVTTHFTLAQRDVRLVRGQAFFEVAHSAVRPFVVYAKSLKVTAVGTEFDVQINLSNTAVTVSNGRVTVTPDGQMGFVASNTETVNAGVGQRVTLSEYAQRLSVATVNPKVAGAWRGGTLSFAGEPLEDVINAINRYNAPPIVVAPAFQRTRFTGTVSPSKVHDWLKALEQIYPVEVLDHGADGILIRSRTDGTSK
jgi:transmembrane sensor